MKKILVVFGDIGSAKEMVPVLKVLEERGIKVSYVADPKGKAATDVLGKAGIPYETKEPADSDTRDLDAYDLILVGTSATANSFQVAWTKYAREKNIPVLWIEDLYGTGSRKNSQIVSPDTMLVVDEVAKQIAKTVRPNLDVRVVGKPTFGALPDEVGAVSIRNKVREKLGLTESEFLVTVGFGGDPAERALTQLPQIISALEAYEDSLTVAWRFHPKHPQKDQLWETATKSKVPFIFGALQWGVKSADDIRLRLRYVRSAETQLRTYTKEIRGAQFAALKNPGAAFRAADVIMEYFR